MIIRGWSIDGFGIFSGYQVSGLPDGMTVIQGPNEAGKSTLLAFIRGILFGFADGRSRDQVYAPLRGGHHGGRLMLEAGSGGVTVERAAGGRHAPLLTFENGESGGETELREILGHADKRLFQSVFAFTLDELSRFETLATEGVGDRIFSAGIAGAGRTAHEAVTGLESESAALYKPRGRKDEIRALLKTVKTLHDEAKQAERTARTYPALVEEERRRRTVFDRLTKERNRALREQRRFEHLEKLWPVWTRLRDAREELAALDRDHDQRLIDLSGRVEKLVAQEETQRERLNNYLPQAVGECKRLTERQQGALRSLGPDWDEDRLAGFDTSLPRKESAREWDTKLDQTRKKLELDRQDLGEAVHQREEAGRRIESLEKTSSEIDVPDQAVLQDRVAALARMRETMAGRNSVGARLESIASDIGDRTRHLERLEHARPWIPRWWLVVIVAGLALAAAAAATRDFLGADRTGAMLFFFIAALFAVGSYALHQVGRAGKRRREGLDAERTTLSDALKKLAEQRESARRDSTRLERDLARLASSLGLVEPVEPDRLEEAVVALEKQRDRRARADLLIVQLENETSVMDRLKSRETLAGDQCRAAESKLRDLERKWESWKSEGQLPVALTPQGILDFLAEVSNAREIHQSLEEARERRKNLESACLAWDESARALLGEASVPLPENDTEEALLQAVAGLDRRCRDQLVKKRRHAELREQIRDYERQLAETAGAGPEAEGFLRTLATGEIETWQEQTARLTGELEGLDSDRDEALRRLQELEQQRKAQEESADVPAVLTELETARCRLAETVRRWQLLNLARGLIRRTLSDYTRTRQPAVIELASRYFNTVTDGEYPRVLQEDDGRSLAVVDHHDRKKSTGTLSRGTAEQLYLCMRLALAGEFARRSVPLPLVMDDVLVNFDPRRSKAMARCLLDVAGGGQQVILFTCHPQTVQCLSGLESSLSVRTLPSDEVDDRGEA